VIHFKNGGNAMKKLPIAELPREIIHNNIAGILKHKPDYTPQLPETRTDIPLQIVRLGATYYSWFFLWTGDYTWYWALEKDCEAETGCTQTKPSCTTHGDVHQEHPAWDNLSQRYVSLLFTAFCADPECGIYHLKPDYDTFPESDGWYYCGVDFYPGFVDCVGQRFNVDGQAVVVYWSYQRDTL
jgi:hypothetical protein